MSTSTYAAREQSVLIIGAGIIGLSLAQAFRKHGIPYEIFERDPTPEYRGSGWGITIHWALQNFLDLLPQDIIDRLPETYVDPDAVKNGEKGNFLFFDLQTGVPRWKVPPSQRLRISREKLRKLLLTGVDVHWSKCLTSISTGADGGPAAYFSDFTFAPGVLILGCDGARSHVREFLCPSAYRNPQLPVRMLGVTHAYPREKALKFRAIDIYFFQGGDPRTSAFLFFAFLDTPTNNNREGEEKDTYLCHISLSYPHRAGFLGRDEPIEVPSSSTERLALMKEISQDWADPFKSIIQDLPDNAEPKRLSIEDWAPGMEGREWDNLGGRVTLVGDSAGAMTMYRGEAYNHGILSTQTLLKNLLPILQSPTFISDPFSIPSSTALATAISTYESELIARTRPAVLASRAACRDAHDYERIGEKSPLVARRIENLAIEEDEGIVKWVEHQGESLKEGPEVAIEA